MSTSERTPSAIESRDDFAARFLHEGYLSLGVNGDWHLPAGVVGHPKLRLFLFKHLHKNREGQYWIVNGPQRVVVAVADAPFFVNGIRSDARTITLELSDASEEGLNPNLFYVGRDNAFYSKVKIGQNGDADNSGHWARFSRPACSQIAAHLVETAGGYALRLAEADYPITNVPRPNRVG